MRTLAVLIAFHDRRQKTIACLDALFAQSRLPVNLKVFAYDDGSTDGTSEEIAKRYPQVEILAGSGDAYWSGAMRSAFSAAVAEGFDFYLWLNDDVKLDPDAIDRLIATYDQLASHEGPLTILGGAVVEPATGTTTYAGIRIRPSLVPLRFRNVVSDPHNVTPCDTLLGNVVLIPSCVVAAIGVIGDRYIHTLGDLDYGLRVRKAGGKVYLAAGRYGECEANRRPGRWFNPNLTLAQRWKILGHPLGMPLRPWLAFSRHHAGWMWPAVFVAPLWRLLVPPSVVRALDQARFGKTSS